jgi:hypothetical protein
MTQMSFIAILALLASFGFTQDFVILLSYLDVYSEGGDASDTSYFLDYPSCSRDPENVDNLGYIANGDSVCDRTVYSGQLGTVCGAAVYLGNGPCSWVNTNDGDQYANIYSDQALTAQVGVCYTNKERCEQTETATGFDNDVTSGIADCYLTTPCADAKPEQCGGKGCDPDYKKRSVYGVSFKA